MNPMKPQTMQEVTKGNAKSIRPSAPIHHSSFIIHHSSWFRISNFRFPISDFKFVSDFDFRISNFNFPTPSPRRRAFSLTEILIVIAIIVLMLALALPAFNFITGGRSIDGATNTLSALLARARTEAVGVQEIRGVMFYIDPKTERQQIALVKETPVQPTDVTGVVYLDTLDGDQVPLPKGIGAQVARSEVTYKPNKDRKSDGYVGFNKFDFTDGLTSVPVGGVILFDGNGRLVNQSYGLRMQVVDSTGNPQATAMTKLIDPNYDASNLPNDFYHNNIATSGFAMVFFDHELFKEKGDDGDRDNIPVNQTYGNDELFEEKWIDENATAVTINRYNGTLIKGD